MLFQSQIFVFLFLPAVLLIHYALLGRTERRVGVAFLVGASFVFYGWFEPAYVVLLALSVAGNYLIGRRLVAHPSRALLAAGVAANLGLLATYKYAGFIVWNIDWAFAAHLPVPEILLPLAISFFTFQQIAYLVDVYRSPSARYSLLDYTLFVVFFPQLIAGPIVHHAEMLPQIARLGRGLRRIGPNLALGLTLFAIGLFKKVAIADTAGVYADIVFDGAAQGVQLGLIEAWFGSFAYGFQIYFDFSGYSDMALGLARMFGLILPLNFFSPYKATSIADFWRRWHITLSRFLRVYLYFPLGGNRKGVARRYANLMAVMLIGGLWHGASWNFVVWGGLHGLYLVVNHLFRGLVRGPSLGAFGRGLGWALTILAVMFAWAPFRAPDIETALAVMWAMLGGNGVALPAFLHAPLGDVATTLAGWGVGFGGAAFRALGLGADPARLGWLAAAAIVAFTFPNAYQWIDRLRPALTYLRRRRRPLPRGLAWRPSLAWAAVVAALLLFAIDYQAKSVEFLYFQF